MNISERIRADIVAALKAGEKERVGALRMLASELQLAQKEAGGAIDEAGETAVLAAEKRKRLQAADGFRAGGREESAAREEAEAALIDEYLPEAMSEAELDAIITEAIAAAGAVDIKAMGKVMASVMPRVAGRADGGAVSAKVKDRLKQG